MTVTFGLRKQKRYKENEDSRDEIYETMEEINIL
jgi:hypothetical protein